MPVPGPTPTPSPRSGVLGPTAGHDVVIVCGASLALAAYVAAANAGVVPHRGVAIGLFATVSGALLLWWGVAAWRVALRRTGWERTAWRWFAATIPVIVAGVAVVWAARVDVAVTPTGEPVESALTLAVYGVLFAGLLVLGLGQAQSRQAWRNALDAAIIAGALFFILWSALYRDRLEDSHLSVAQGAAVIAYPFLDAALLTLAALSLGVPDPTRPRGYRFLLAGLALTFAGDVVATYLILVGSDLVLPLYAAAYTAGLGFLALSAVAVGRQEPWVPKGNPAPASATRLLPLVALAPAMGAAAVAVVEHGALSPVQFWTAFAVIALVLLQLALTLRQAVALESRLREESAFKTRLLRFISHEVANPLSPLRLQASILRTRTRGANDARAWDIVERSIDRLASLSRDVREMALAETQRLLSVVEVADAGAQVAAAAHAAAPVAKERGLELSLEASLEALPVRIDLQRFGQVVDNLLSNAIKFTHAPGTITVRTRRDGGNARIEVTDSGIGMSAADRDGLFQPFRRARDSAAPGLGLGLYLCHAIMAELHGAIGVDSPGRGQGSTFWVTLPLEGTDPDPVPLGGTRRPLPAEAPASPVATLRLT